MTIRFATTPQSARPSQRVGNAHPFDMTLARRPHRVRLLVYPRPRIPNKYFSPDRILIAAPGKRPFRRRSLFARHGEALDRYSVWFLAAAVFAVAVVNVIDWFMDNAVSIAAYAPTIIAAGIALGYLTVRWTTWWVLLLRAHRGTVFIADAKLWQTYDETEHRWGLTNTAGVHVWDALCAVMRFADPWSAATDDLANLAWALTHHVDPDRPTPEYDYERFIALTARLNDPYEQKAIYHTLLNTLQSTSYSRVLNMTLMDEYHRFQHKLNQIADPTTDAGRALASLTRRSYDREQQGVVRQLRLVAEFTTDTGVLVTLADVRDYHVAQYVRNNPHTPEHVKVLLALSYPTRTHWNET